MYRIMTEVWIIDGILTLYDVSFQRTFTQVANENISINYNSLARF